MIGVVATLLKAIHIPVTRFQTWLETRVEPDTPEPRPRPYFVKSKHLAKQRTPEVSDHDLETLRYLCKDSRRVLDHQIDDIDDIDDKALRTVRITVLVFGLLVAAIGIESIDIELGAATELGAISLLASIAMGMITYSTSYPHLGPGPEYIDSVLDAANTERKERIEALKSYADWMMENEETVQKNALCLALTQFFLIVGLALVGYDIGSEVLDGYLYTALQEWVKHG